MSVADEVAIATHPGKCEEEVSRKGEAQPCDKQAVAVRNHEEGPYPVCGYHTRFACLSLAEVLRIAREHIPEEWE